MLRIVDRTGEPEDGERVARRGAKRLIAIHRCTVGSDVAEISTGYYEDPALGQHTSNQIPYHFVVGRDGRVEQARRIADILPHARRFGAGAIGVAVVGDCRDHPPSAAQRASLVSLCYALSPVLRGDRIIYGHTELVGGVAEECPGRLLDLDALRHDVDELCRRELARRGIKI